MRISRTPLPQSAIRPEDRADPDERPNETLTDGDLVQLPEWQRAFVLGPNVRFTRTPESAYARKTGAQQAVEAQEAIAAPATVTPHIIIEPVAASEMQAHAAALEPAPVLPAPLADPVPTDDAANAPLSLYLRLKREMSAASRSASAEVSAQAARPELARIAKPMPRTDEASMTPTRAAQPAAALDFPVSDYVFWESMASAADFARLVPAPRRALPSFEADAGTIVALYREVDCGRGAGVPKAAAIAIKVLPPVAPRPATIQTTPAPARPEVAPHQASPAVAPEIPAVPPQPAPVAAPAATPVAGLPPVTTIIAAPERRRPAVVTAEAEYEFPPVSLLQQPAGQTTHTMTPEALEQSAGLLESVLEDFGVKGEIIDVRPGPVVTLYEFEPAPGVKSSRVIGLSDDIARSMSALSARVAVVPGRNVIGIELPNAVRETVYFRELIECESYWETKFKLAVCLGKTIGGEPVIAELAKMPHLLVAGTTGSGKSVAINTMILSLLYRLRPEECRLIMVDPKMLELSIYDGIPHLLTPVVTDPKKAVMALKWAVREMEDRYRKMSRLGVRNIDGFNARAASARAKGETVMCDVPKGFDRSTGEPIYEQEEMDLTPMPYIVVIVDEMADLMMVAGKEIEGAIQRLAQMARAAGIHLIMATQRPSVDVITGTIKANFPTRISFQVTSKIDSRTILGEQGAEHLLGQGDMLHMVGGGRINRVHGPFVSDEEVEKVVQHLKMQGRPEYLGTVTEDADEEEAAEPEETAVFDKSAMGEDDGDDLYEKAIKVVMRDKKCSTSYIQRRLSIGYNRAASLVERMEKDGLVGPANHVGKREILGANREREPAEPSFSHDEE